MEIGDDNTTIHVEVFESSKRADVFKDAIEEIRHLENIRFPLEVSFFGEAAMDLGGPRKEFFSLFMRQFFEKLISDDNTLVLNTEYIARHYYFYSGLILGLSVIEGAEFLSLMPRLITSVANSNEEHQMQFADGLKRTGIFQLLLARPLVGCLLEDTKKLNAGTILQICNTNFSEEGTNRRWKEEAAYRFFVKYCRDVYTGRRGDVFIEKVLKFPTGSPAVPVFGYTVRPSIEFHDQIDPTASTCINKLYLPLDNLRQESFDMTFVNDFFGLEK